MQGIRGGGGEAGGGGLKEAKGMGMKPEKVTISGLIKGQIDIFISFYANLRFNDSHLFVETRTTK